MFKAQYKCQVIIIIIISKVTYDIHRLTITKTKLQIINTRQTDLAFGYCQVNYSGNLTHYQQALGTIISIILLSTNVISVT